METKITVTPEEVAENMKDVLVRTVVEFGKPCTYVTVRMKTDSRSASPLLAWTRRTTTRASANRFV